MSRLENELEAVLENRRSIAKIRRLVVNPANAIDFSSNDFLGLATNDTLRTRFLAALAQSDRILGSTGSRLLDGNSALAETLERQMAVFHKAESALLFNSGFDANVGLFSTLPQKGDVVLYDELVHASVHEGMRMSRAALRLPFKHSDVADLERLLREIRPAYKGRHVFVAVETVYSMDGDIAPLQDIVDVLRSHWPRRENGYLIVDEAHATGVYGDHGRGIVSLCGLEHEVFARVHTFSKALASNGAAVLGSTTLRNYLINYARPLIYSTFMPHNALILTQCAYNLLESGLTVPLQNHLHSIIHRFRDTIRLPTGTLLPSPSPVQGVILNGNSPVRALATFLNERGFVVKPICSPTVPKGQERVRICLHGNNTVAEVDSLVQAIHDFFKADNSKEQVSLVAKL